MVCWCCWLWCDRRIGFFSPVLVCPYEKKVSRFQTNPYDFSKWGSSNIRDQRALYLPRDGFWDVISSSSSLFDVLHDLFVMCILDDRCWNFTHIIVLVIVLLAFFLLLLLLLLFSDLLFQWRLLLKSRVMFHVQIHTCLNTRPDLMKNVLNCW